MRMTEERSNEIRDMAIAALRAAEAGLADMSPEMQALCECLSEIDYLEGLLENSGFACAELASAKSENDKLRLEFVAKSELIEDLKGELAFYKYEELARRFYEENGKGMMAPGKSDIRGYHTFEERSEAWQKWLEERGDVNPLESVLASAKAWGYIEGLERAEEIGDNLLGTSDGRADLCEAYDMAVQEYRSRIRSLLTDTPKG